MLTLLWFLLPVAAASGWYVARKTDRQRYEGLTSSISPEYIQGLNYLLDEKPDKALEVFLRIVEVDAETVETHLLLGNLFRRRGEVDRAIRIHQNLLSRPGVGAQCRQDALLELGRDYLKAGLLDRAEELFQQVIAQNGHKRAACRHLMEVYEQEKDWESAIQVAQQLQDAGDSHEPVVAHYYCEIAESRDAAGHTSEAEDLARKALSRDRACARASILLGDMALRASRYGRAIKFYSKVYQQDTDYICMVLPRLRDAYARRNDAEGYLGYLRQIQPCGCDQDIVFTLLESYLKDGDLQRVASVFESEFRKERVALAMVREYVKMVSDGAIPDGREALEKVVAALDSYIDSQVSYQCNSCGFESRGLFWQCPGCHGWGTVRPVGSHVAQPRKAKHYSL